MTEKQLCHKRKLERKQRAQAWKASCSRARARRFSWERHKALELAKRFHQDSSHFLRPGPTLYRPTKKLLIHNFRPPVVIRRALRPRCGL